MRSRTRGISSNIFTFSGSDLSLVLYATIRMGMFCYNTKGTTQSKYHRQSLDTRYLEQVSTYVSGNK